LTAGNKPSPAAGARNGYVPASMRANVNSKCSMYNFAAGPLAVMIQDAAKAGIQLTTSSCYRDYVGQVAVRKYWCSVGQCGNAAVPGTSNHGWGKAVDFAGMTWTSANRRWMEANGGRYGFVPLSIESWHWDWVGDGGTMHGNFIRHDLWFWYQSH
jgi:LAS superfamily LD-carboxypeptidase LdcB